MAAPGGTARAVGAPAERDAGRTGSASLIAVVLAGTVVLAVLVAVGVLAATGQLVSVVPGLFDPGPLTRYGLPAARAVHDLAAALSVGLLVLAAWIVGPESSEDRDGLTGIRQRTVKLAVAAIGVWLVAAVAVLVLTAAEVSGLKPGSPGFLGMVASFVAQVDLGRALGVSILAIAVAGWLAVAATRIATVAWAAALSLLALLPLAVAATPPVRGTT